MSFHNSFFSDYFHPFKRVEIYISMAQFDGEILNRRGIIRIFQYNNPVKYQSDFYFFKITPKEFFREYILKDGRSLRYIYFKSSLNRILGQFWGIRIGDSKKYTYLKSPLNSILVLNTP